MADVACPKMCQPVWPACWLDTPDRSSSSAARVVQDVWDVCRDELGVVPAEVVLALKDAASREVELFVAGDLVGCIGPVRVMMLMCIVLSTLLTLLLLLLSSFVGVSILLRMCLRVSGIREGFTQSRRDALLGCWEAECRHGPCGPISSLGIGGFPRVYMVSIGGFLIPLS